MQLPTLQNTRIRNLADAHKIFYAVEQGILNMITTRLDVAERAALKAGNIYVWEQRKGNSEASGIGIERFTEGRKWSASRIREDFLLYEEKWPTSPTSPDDDTPRNWKPLTKHTYSTVVDLPQGQRKWHISTLRSLYRRLI
ncbi:Gti1/Pac2 family-domain-containing protein [Flagelloscypha sp. PMI_526]|nr:Gti1/Pac2 family-domain-containing protein [Flagelloscypha sp. PMI_526]